MGAQVQADSNNDNFAQLFEESIQSEIKEGSVTDGTVVAIENGYAVVEVSNAKSESNISLKDFGDESEVKIGDVIKVYVESYEDRYGSTVLSRSKALREEYWDKFQDLHEKDVNVEGKIIGRVKGGFAVDLGGIIAFLPGSQVDIRPIKDISALVEITQPFKILKMDKDQGNIVVSRRAILEESRQEARDELLSNIAEGVELEGYVKNITDYGAFVDLGPIDGLLHITDISWDKISHPSEVLELNQTIKVKVIKYNQDTQRVSLGLKQLKENPWTGLADKYKEGMKSKGVITTVTDYGAFVEIEPNIEGLVYHTEISWNAKNIHPKKLVKIGDEVEVTVLEVDIDKHRIGLSMKQCFENPWEKFIQDNPIGTEVEGTIKNIADFGMFVTVNEANPLLAIDALIPIVELSWDANPEKELKNYKPGDVIKGVVTTTDLERERVTVSIKQLSGNEKMEAAGKYPVGSTVSCAVVEVKKEGLEVEVDAEIKGFIKRMDLSKHRDEQKVERFSAGDRLSAKVIGVDKSTFNLGLSIKSLEIEKEKQAIAEYGSTDSGASLGDILGEALNKK